MGGARRLPGVSSQTVPGQSGLMDRLSALLSRFSLEAGVFYAGPLCVAHDFEADSQRGHLHLVRQGVAHISGLGQAPLRIDTPTLVFLPRPQRHRFHAGEADDAEVVCGTVRFGSGGRNPITDSLPDVVTIALSALPGMAALLDLMFAEAFADHGGRQAALDRLCEVLMIWVLRHCVDTGLTQGGTLAGLADPSLARALQALHAEPAKGWTLPMLADAAGMSRSRFAARFHEVTRETPAEYLARWRLALAQRLLRQGRPLKHVAYEVGYGSTGALARVFDRYLGCTPTEWLRTIGR